VDELVVFKFSTILHAAKEFSRSNFLNAATDPVIMSMMTVSSYISEWSLGI
jgi:hypothetical protein